MALSALPPTEFEFVLPRGLVDEGGVVHRQGVMRLATARDELMLGRDRKAADNSTYGDLVMLARVITRLGTLPEVTAPILEDLFTMDLSYLRELYNQINQHGEAHVAAQCPQCSHQFEVELALSGES